MRSTRITVEPVARLIDELGRLPGVGPKSASRMAYFLLRAPREQALALAEAVIEVKDRIILCSRCFNITEEDPCAVCQDTTRDQRVICVVEEPLDVLALDRTGEYRGLYHVLHGAISPVDGIGPDKLRIRELVERVERERPAEVILAMNPNIEGDATAMYIARQLVSTGITISRPASGLPVGGDLEYADEITLGRALTGRRVL
ncbi:MAG TPA: recombination mediator RecR [Thermomicrobiales bacterium]|nr:recombination protein RecR [Chloroflexota bacterium]HCG29629.1 recombination protein RecR [Chloroflexota bacterium]HQZ89588.1 recombination mediator RecR [Thermomicrobiales bacterium]HRA31169.1 recombination mediator RecR [Thermomicrobiales bacterium]